MEKIEKCPNCGEEQPPLTLYLEQLEQYVNRENTPDKRVYALTCIKCGYSIEKFTVENTITAVKALRSEMDRIYGESFMVPLLYQT